MFVVCVIISSSIVFCTCITDEQKRVCVGLGVLTKTKFSKVKMSIKKSCRYEITKYIRLIMDDTIDTKWKCFHHGISQYMFVGIKFMFQSISIDENYNDTHEWSHLIFH